MNVFGTGPKPPQNHTWRTTNGVSLYFRGGDVYRPDIRNGWPRRGYEDDDRDWFNTHPKSAWRWHCKWPVLPFLTFKWGSFGMYVGFKAFGVDSEAYRDFPLMQRADVYNGSVALTPSIRFSRSRAVQREQLRERVA